MTLESIGRSFLLTSLSSVQVTNYYRAYSNVRFSGSDTCVLLASDMKHEGKSGELLFYTMNKTNKQKYPDWYISKDEIMSDRRQYIKFIDKVCINLEYIVFQELMCSVSPSATQTPPVLVSG